LPTTAIALTFIVVSAAIRALTTIIALIAIPASHLVGFLTSIRLLHALTDSDTHANHGTAQVFHLIIEFSDLNTKFFDLMTKLIYLAGSISP